MISPKTDSLLFKKADFALVISRKIGICYLKPGLRLWSDKRFNTFIPIDKITLIPYQAPILTNYTAKRTLV